MRTGESSSIVLSGLQDVEESIDEARLVFSLELDHCSISRPYSTEDSRPERTAFKFNSACLLVSALASKVDSMQARSAATSMATTGSEA